MTKLFDSAALAPGRSMRFPLPPLRGRFGPLAVEGFAYRFADGKIRAWVNLCPHRSQALDLGDGRLFNAIGEIECHAHGARFDAESGACTAGPCPGASLQPVLLDERDGSVWLP